MLEALSAAVDQVVGADPSALADPESVKVLYKELERLGAAAARASAAFEAAGSWEGDHARNARCWIAWQCNVSRATAGRRLGLGRALRHLPVAEAAWLAGEISESHVAALAAARTPATEAALARDEELLVGHARRLRFDHFGRALAYWQGHADPDGAEADAARQRDDRRLHLSRSAGGSWVLDGVLDPVSGSIVSEALRRIEDELFDADWAEGRARLGEDVCAERLRRTPAQRRADALVEMATRAGTAPAEGRRPEPLFSVFVGFETFAGRICELADGTVVSPGSLVEWLDRAWIERVVFDAASRLIDVGVARRLFAGATRRGVQLRDRECYHPSCDERAHRCEVDHVVPWSEGGPTTLANGRPACRFHNRIRGRRRGPPGDG